MAIRIITPNTNISPQSIDETFIKDAAVTEAKIADGSITAAKIADGTIIAQELASDSVTTIKILDANITTAKILDANVTVAKMAVNSVDSDQYVDGSIDTVHIADDAVTLAKISTTGASDNQILVYDHASTSIGWETPSVHYTDADAISAIEGEATLDLTGKLTIDKATVPASDVIFSSGAFNVADVSEMSVRSATTTPLTMVRQANLSGWGQLMLMQRELNQSIAGLDNTDLQGTNISQAFSLADEVSAKYVGQHLVKITDVTVAGSAGSSYLDTFKGQYCLSVYNKTTGAVETFMHSLTTETAFTEVSNELRVVNKGDAGGRNELSSIKLVYTGAQYGAPTGKIQLRQEDNLTTTDLITMTTGAVEFNKPIEGITGLFQGSSSGLTGPILELETDNSGWNRPQLMLKDSNGDAVSIVGQHNTTQDLYQLNYTLDPNNTHGRTGVTTYAGDYFIGFNKNYTDQSAISMNMRVFGANDGFNINAYDDFNSGGGNQYGAKPIRLKGNQVELWADGTEGLKVDSARVTISSLTRLHNAASDPGSPLEGDVYYNTGTDRIKLYTGAGWKTLSVD